MTQLSGYTHLTATTYALQTTHTIHYATALRVDKHNNNNNNAFFVHTTRRRTTVSAYLLRNTKFTFVLFGKSRSSQDIAHLEPDPLPLPYCELCARKTKSTTVLIHSAYESTTCMHNDKLYGCMFLSKCCNQNLCLTLRIMQCIMHDRRMYS